MSDKKIRGIERLKKVIKVIGADIGVIKPRPEEWQEHAEAKKYIFRLEASFDRLRRAKKRLAALTVIILIRRLFKRRKAREFRRMR